jgi:ERCC4-type nuclease
VQVDSREKAHAIQKILDTFDQRGIQWFVSKLPVGDYQSLDNPRLVIDRKQSLSELCNNVCQGHKRFRAELVRANEYGIKLIVLVEHGRGIETMQDIMGWQNPRLKTSPMAVSGERLYKILSAMSSKYNVDFLFCTKAQTGAKIIELLRGENGGARENAT